MLITLHEDNSRSVLAEWARSPPSWMKGLVCLAASLGPALSSRPKMELGFTAVEVVVVASVTLVAWACLLMAADAVAARYESPRSVGHTIVQSEKPMWRALVMNNLTFAAMSVGASNTVLALLEAYEIGGSSDADQQAMSPDLVPRWIAVSHFLLASSLPAVLVLRMSA